MFCFDFVVLVILNFNWVFYGVFWCVLLNVFYVIVIIDFVDCLLYFWMEDQDQIMICGMDFVYWQVIILGFYKLQDIYFVLGMILKDNFYMSVFVDVLICE